MMHIDDKLSDYDLSRRLLGIKDDEKLSDKLMLIISDMMQILSDVSDDSSPPSNTRK